MSEATQRLLARIENLARNEETQRIIEIILAHADHDERGNKALVDLILAEIAVG